MDKKQTGRGLPPPNVASCFCRGTTRRAPTLTAAPMPDIVRGQSTPCYFVKGVDLTLLPFEGGVGDYTKERQRWLRGLKVKDIVREIKERRKVK